MSIFADMIETMLREYYIVQISCCIYIKLYNVLIAEYQN